ncbi:MAG: AAA family ATPase [Candidatus Dormibacteraeota bacterium]|nr:AAA family ATPase [Candidatus Dormibacteraeota bacterium]
MSNVMGRDAELVAVRRFLDAAAAGPCGLLLEGETGMGKTTLWRASVQAAAERGIAVLSAGPTESDRDLPFAVLGDLFRNIPEATWALVPLPQRRALQIALLQADPQGAPIEPHAIALGVLSMLQALSRRQPQLIAVDDLHWVDTPSIRALQFAFRRMVAEPTSVLFTSRPAAAESERRTSELLDPARIETLWLGPLTVEVLDEILSSQLTAAFSQPTLRQLQAATGGNPLFALEIGRSLLMKGSVRRMDEPLPIPDDLNDLVRGRLRNVPSATLDILLVAAALSQPTEALLGAVTGSPGTVGSVLQPAVDARLIRFEGPRIRFAYPLIGSVIYASATPGQRQRLHQRIAAVVNDADECAHHLALGTEGTDGRVAGLLEQAGRRANVRGAPEVAATLLEKAAWATPPEEAEHRAHRFVSAVDYHLRAGETARARTLLEERLESMPVGVGRARVLQRLAKVRFAEEGVAPTEELLTAALLEGTGDPLLHAALERDLAMTLIQSGRLQEAATHSASSRRLAEQLHNEWLLSSARAHEAATSYFLTGQLSSGTMERLIALAERAPRDWEEAPPAFLEPAFIRATLLKWSDDFAAARLQLVHLLEWMARRQDDSTLTPLFFHLGELEAWAGNFDVATDYARRARTVVRHSALHARLHMVLTLEALIHSHIGDVEAARVTAQKALAQAEQTGDVQFQMRNLRTLGFIELSLDNLPDAGEWFRRLSRLFDGGGYGAPGVIRFHADSVEVMLGLGDVNSAHLLSTWLEERAQDLQQPWARVMAARSRGLMQLAAGEVNGGLASLANAVQLHDSVPQPFERARTLLLEGTALRRAKQKRAARESLYSAQQLFQDLGVTLWERRAQAEITRLGRRRLDPGLLTPTETRVADLVAAGQTNREVATRLFLSVKTVEASLSRIYQKVGVRSRAELAATLAPRGKP